MKTLFVMLAGVAALSGCISSSNPAPPQKDTTVVVQPQNGQTTVVCSDGTQPPCH